MEQTSKMSRAKKITLAVIGVLLLIVLGLGITVYAVWHNELSTLQSIRLLRERNDEHLDGAVYTMHVKGGFYLDEFIEQGGVQSDDELIAFITNNITKGLMDMSFDAILHSNRRKRG